MARGTHPSTHQPLPLQVRRRPRGSRCSWWGGSSLLPGRSSHSMSRASRSTSTPRDARAATPAPRPRPAPHLPSPSTCACPRLEHNSEGDGCAGRWRASWSQLRSGLAVRRVYTLALERAPRGGAARPAARVPPPPTVGRHTLCFSILEPESFAPRRLWRRWAERREVCAHLFVLIFLDYA